MKYHKGSHVFAPKGDLDWMHYYAGPVSSLEFEDFIRVYFSTRDRLNEKGHFRTLITYVDCDKDDPSKVLYVHERPLFDVGLPGSFDEHGTMIADVICHEGRYYLYYMGWQRSDTVPYIIRLGLAMSDNGSDFKKISEGPVIGLSRHLPFGIGNVSILFEEGEFRMWYTHYLPWLKSDQGYKPAYELRYATSVNGLDWVLKDTCIPYVSPKEVFATPCVRKRDGQYHMWYSYRQAIDEAGNNGKYLIGYATSIDRVNWKRFDDSVDLHKEPEWWNSEMVCYPDVLQMEDRSLIFYCGNRYGETGFGYATIEF